MCRIPLRRAIRITGSLLIPLAFITLTTRLFATTQPVTLDPTTPYTHFIFEDVSLSNGSAAAPVAYGGNVILQNNNIGKLDGNCDPTDIALTVGGSLSYTASSIYDGGGVVSGTITSGGGTGMECGSVMTGSVAINFDAVDMEILQI